MCACKRALVNQHGWLISDCSSVFINALHESCKRKRARGEGEEREEINKPFAKLTIQNEKIARLRRI